MSESWATAAMTIAFFITVFSALAYVSYNENQTSIACIEAGNEYIDGDCVDNG